MPNTKPVGVAYSDPELSGATIDNSPIGATTPNTIVGTTVYSALEIGYSAAAQGAVTQATSKETSVTLNKPAGQITLNGSALGPGATAIFTLNNSMLHAKDVLIVNVGSGGTNGAYWPYVADVNAGSADIGIYNNTAGSLSEAIVLNFAIFHNE
jgi:hypothetical protein